MKRFYTLHIPPQGHKASIQHQKRFWLTAIALTRRSLRYFFFSRQPHQSRVPGNACERRRWRVQRAGVGAAVETARVKASIGRFGHRKRGACSRRLRWIQRAGVSAAVETARVKACIGRFGHRKRGACERRRWRMQRAGVGAAVETARA